MSKQRQCRTCGRTFTTEFARSRRVYCQEYCAIAGIDRASGKALWQLYKLTQAGFDAWLTKQNGCCAICGSPPTPADKGRLHVDHDHKTDRVRGLLCGLCNRALGRADAVVDWLDKAKHYLITRS